QADSTDITALEQLGAAQFSTAVVGIGSSLENSVLTVANLVDLGVETIWAKAITHSHGTILTRIGATNVVFPAQDAGERTAHLLAGTMSNVAEVCPGYSLVDITVTHALTEKPIADLRIKDRFEVTIVTVEREDGFQNLYPHTLLEVDVYVIVAGTT